MFLRPFASAFNLLSSSVFFVIVRNIFFSFLCVFLNFALFCDDCYLRFSVSAVVLQCVSLPGGVAGLPNCEVRSVDRDGLRAMSDRALLSDLPCIIAIMHGRLLNRSASGGRLGRVGVHCRFGSHCKPAWRWAWPCINYFKTTINVQKNTNFRAYI